MATLTSSLIVRLVDQVTQPARAISRSLLGLNNQAKGGFGSRLGEAIERNNRALSTARGKLFDAAAGFYVLRSALGAPLNAAANFETALEDIGQKAGIPQERLAALGEQIKKVARDTNQATMNIAGAIDNLVGRGASEDVALAAAGPIGKAATAYRASADDLAAASWSAVDNLKVPANQIGTAIDMMAQAGKEGAFELKDMAQYFPKLGAQYQGLGQTGVGAVADLAAALQIVRKGTGDASSAATNLSNVLQKVYSNTTIKNFKKLGVNIRKEMEKAAKEGKTPIEAIAEITNKALDGDLSKLGQIFEDAQVQEGMRSLIQNMEEYRRVRSKALAASGVVDEDFARRLKTAQGAMDRWKASMENLNIALGTTLLPLLNDILDRVIPLIDKFGEWAASNPELARGLVATAAGLIAFKVAMTGLTFVGLLGRGGALSLLSLGFNSVGRSVIGASRAAKNAVGLQEALATMSGAKFGNFAKIGVAIRGIAMAAPGVGLISGALTAIGTAIAGISLPIAGAIALAVGAIAAAGVLIWKYWDRITSVMSGFFSRLGSEFTPAIEAARPALDWLGGVGKVISDSFGWAMTKLQEFGSWIGSFFQQEVLSEQVKQEWSNSGYQMADRMITSIKTKVMEIVEWFKGLPGMILNAIGSIDLGSMIKWPSPPDWWTNMFGGGAPAAPAQGPAPGSSGKKKLGGNVWQGGSFLVGEEQPEIFTPRTSGTITPLSKAGGGSKTVTVGQIVVQGAHDPQATAVAVRREIEGLFRGAHSDSEAWA